MGVSLLLCGPIGRTCDAGANIPAFPQRRKGCKDVTPAGLEAAREFAYVCGSEG